MSVRIDWLGYSGFRALRTSAPVADFIEGKADEVLDRAQAGAGRSEFGKRSYPGGNRHRVSVGTENVAAIVRNKKYDTLVRALYGG